MLDMMVQQTRLNSEWTEASAAGDGFTVVESTTGAGDPSGWGSVAGPPPSRRVRLGRSYRARSILAPAYYFSVCKVGAVRFGIR